MGITKIELSFEKYVYVLGVVNVGLYYEKAMAAYYQGKDVIVLNLPLIMDTVINRNGEEFKADKTFEEAICFCLTHEEIHHWLHDNIGQLASIQFDNIAQKFMEDM